MTERIGAIETEYKGCRFRSRLEARWAVFFDVLGIEWRYEEQGFEGGGARYLPDFFVPDKGMWCEVKGNDAYLKADAERMSKVILSGALHGILGSSGTHTNGLLLLGEVPDPSSDLVFHPIIQHDAQLGLVRSWLMFLKSSDGADAAIDRGDGVFAALHSAQKKSHLETDLDGDGWSTRVARVRNEWLWQNDVNEAYLKARQARFEHGARG